MVVVVVVCMYVFWSLKNPVQGMPEGQETGEPGQTIPPLEPPVP